LRSPGSGEYATRQGRRPSLPRTPPRCSRARSASDSATTATRHCPSCLSSSASAASAHSSLPQLLALLTQSALSRSLTSAARPRRSIVSGFPGVEDVGSGIDPQFLATATREGSTAAGLRLPNHALGSASALAGRLVAAAVNLSGELRMCQDGHHRDNEQPVLSSEGCEAGTPHIGVSFPTSSLCF
jgi:hypothetical protein